MVNYTTGGRFSTSVKMVGIDNVEYYNPDYRDEKVYEVYLNVTKPFDTTDISTDMFEQIKRCCRKCTSYCWK